MEDYVKIVYGIGNCFEEFKSNILSYHIDFFCDKRLTSSNDKDYLGVPVIDCKELLKFNRKTKCYICMYDKIEIMNIYKQISVNPNIEIVLPGLYAKKEVTGKYLKGINCGEYKDCFDNIIYFSSNIPDNCHIKISGKEGMCSIGNNIRIGERLNINMGTYSKIQIGEDSTFVNANIFCSYGEVFLGRDCMISHGVFVRNNDGHHIFDKETGERINVNKDIYIYMIMFGWHKMY